MPDASREVSLIVRDVADGKLTTNAAVQAVGDDPGRMHEALVSLCDRYHRMREHALSVADENLRLRLVSPTAIYARRCWRLALVCLLLSAITQAIVLFR
jgi:hypothetical protein